MADEESEQMTVIYETFKKENLQVIGKNLPLLCLDKFRVDQLSDMGYPRAYIEQSVMQMEANYCTAGYYLLAM